VDEVEAGVEKSRVRGCTCRRPGCLVAQADRLMRGHTSLDAGLAVFGIVANDKTSCAFVEEVVRRK
jgi:hypothetical protein